MQSNLRTIPIGQVRLNPNNVRQWKATEKAQLELGASIATHGILQPLLVTPIEGEDDTFMVLAGNRRLAAAIALNLQAVPCLVRLDADRGTGTAMALAENLIRADMSPVDVWKAVLRCHEEGWRPAEIADAIGRSEQRVRQLILMGSMPAPVLDYMGATGDFPNDGQVRVIAQAEASLVTQHFQDLQSRQGKGFHHGFPWWQLADRLRIDRIEASRAAFAITDEDRAKLDLRVDLFEAGDHPGFFYNVEGFMARQRDVLIDKLAVLKAMGIDGEMIDSGHGIPASCTYESKEEKQAKSIKKADRKDWLAVGRISSDGRMWVEIYKKRPKPATAPKASGAADAVATEEDKPNQPATDKGMLLIEAAKRQHVAAALPTLGTHDLLLIMTLLLAHKLHMGEAVTGLFAESGAIDCDNDDRIPFIRGIAATLMGEAIGKTPTSKHAEAVIPAWLVERIGKGLCLDVLLKATRADLDQLKRPVIDALRSGLKVADYPRQSEVKDGIIRAGRPDSMAGLPLDQGTVTIGERYLPALAWKFASDLPYGWAGRRSYAAGPEEDGDMDEDDGDALADAGLGTDEDYGGLDEAA